MRNLENRNQDGIITINKVNKSTIDNLTSEYQYLSSDGVVALCRKNDSVFASISNYHTLIFDIDEHVVDEINKFINEGLNWLVEIWGTYKSVKNNKTCWEVEVRKTDRTVNELKICIENQLEHITYEEVLAKNYVLHSGDGEVCENDDVLFVFKIPFKINDSINDIMIYCLRGQEDKVYVYNEWHPAPSEFEVDEIENGTIDFVDYLDTFMIDIAALEIESILQ